jgi:ferric-dicitrate binding protein FerR (iron transport regulator)
MTTKIEKEMRKRRDTSMREFGEVLRRLRDPIYPALKRHQEAWEQFLATLPDLAKAEKAKPRNQARIAAAQRLQERYCDKLKEAEAKLAATIPTTIWGIVAALAYQRAMTPYPDEGMFGPEDRETFAMSLEIALRD